MIKLICWLKGHSLSLDTENETLDRANGREYYRPVVECSRCHRNETIDSSIRIEDYVHRLLR